MADIDYGEAWDFVDNQGRALHLRFRRNWADQGDPRIFDGTGQLIAVAGSVGNDDVEIAISRPDLALAEINSVMEGWQDWATLIGDDIYRMISLNQIQRRINEAGLGLDNT